MLGTVFPPRRDNISILYKKMSGDSCLWTHTSETLSVGGNCWGKSLGQSKKSLLISGCRTTLRVSPGTKSQYIKT
jgi:hypothetical protein